MMKITQLLTNLKLWQSTFVAFVFLFSLSMNSQNVGDDLMATTNGALTTEQVTGSGTGCAPCGWTATNGTNYAPTNGTHGPVHSPDRMWKMFANNSGNGEFVAQEFSQLPLGTYTLTFYHRWTNCGNLDYSNGGPALSFKMSDGSGGWTNVNDPIEVPQSNCGANADWTEMTVTYEVTEVNDYRVQIYKNGANGLNASLHLDTFSFVYTAAAAASTACGDTVTYTQVANGDFTDGVTAPAGQNASVTINATMENGWDFLYVTDGAGNALNAGETTGVFTDATYTSTDGTISVNVTNDGSVQNGDVTLVFTCAEPMSALSLQGILDIDVSGGVGKGVHLVASADIADLSVYGLGSANNQQGTDGQEFTLSGSISAGQNILVTNSAADATGADVFLDGYLAGHTFDLIINGAGGALQGNGNDAYELFFNDSVVDTYGVTGNVGDSSQSGDYSMDWAYQDSWAYKVDGVWTTGGNSCTDGSVTTCESDCPYPFVECPPTAIVAPWTDDFEDVDISDWTLLQAADASTGWVLATENAAGNIAMYHADDNVATGVDNYLVSPFLDCSGLTAPLFSFTERNLNASYYVNHEVLTSDDFDGTNAATATWTVIHTGVAPAEMTTLEFSIPSTTTGIAFRYEGDYADNWLVDDVSVIETPTDPIMEVSATTDGASATFSFDIENFTVGAAAGEGDGHIHYSLNGGAEVMVYSTDDLTLTGLPNGDHTIVFSLVDADHQPLDPAVEATVEFSTFDGTAVCDETVTYTQVASGDYTVSVTAPEGQNASVTVNATMENGWDFLYVTDGAGNALNAGETTGVFTDATYTSTDGTISVNVTNDGSVQNGDVTLAFTCETPQTLVTLSVNTANITVGENGMYAGGGILGNAMAYMMSDDDGDGVYEVTISLDTGATGNYIFINSPANGDDYNGKENLEGQECADGQWNDRLFPEIVGDAMTLLHCFGECSGNGTGECPAPAVTHDITFSIDPSNYNNGEGIADTDQLYVSGSFNGWSGDANPMSDDDGDGIWEVTIAIEDGTYEYKFTMNNWTVQEEFGSMGVIEGCTASADGNFVNRSLTVAGEDMVLPTVYWNLCPGETPGEVYNITFNLDATGIDVGANGMFMGGGVLGGANAVPMTDEDGDGIWTVTVELSTDQIGLNYTYVNSPNDGGDYSGKEDISGQDCADGQWNDRMLPEFSGDAEFCFVFAVCTDGSCEGTVSTATVAPWSENFNQINDGSGWSLEIGQPGGWNTMNNGESDTGSDIWNAWSLNPGLAPADDTDAYTLYHDDDDTGGAGNVDNWIITPFLDCTQLTEPMLSFVEYQTYAVTWYEFHAVYYSEDYDGTNKETATWTELQNGSAPVGEPTIVEHAIPSTTTAIAWRYQGDYADNWFIDDVMVGDASLSTTDTELLDMRIYPNPVDGNYVTIQSPIQGLKEIEVYTVTGRKVLQTVLTDDKLDVSSFNSGFYMVKVTINGQSKLSKLIVR